MSMGQAIDFMAKCPFCQSSTIYADTQKDPDKMWWKCSVCLDKPKDDGTQYNIYLGDYQRGTNVLTYNLKFNTPATGPPAAAAAPTPAPVQVSGVKRTAEEAGLPVDVYVDKTARLMAQVERCTAQIEHAAKMLDFMIRLFDRFGPKTDEEYTAGIDVAKDVLDEDPTQQY